MNDSAENKHLPFDLHNNLPIHFQLFGAPAIFYQQQPLDIPRKNVRLLAFYLAAQGQPVTRRNLAFTFWPDVSDEKSAANLREHLSKLRAHLPDRAMLITRQDLVYFDPERITCDTLSFLQQVSELNQQLARFPSPNLLPSELLEALESVIQIKGDHDFLEHVNTPSSDVFEKWLLETRNEIDFLYARLVERAVEAFLANQDLVSAIEHLNLIVNAEDPNPMLHYRLLKLMLGAQQYSLARSYCKYIEDLYDSAELDLESGVLGELVRTIRQENTIITSEVESRWQKRFPDQLPYVGQQQAFAQMADALDVGIFLLYGETGSGRSRMAYEFYHRHLSHCRPLQIESHHFEGLLPYLAIKDLIQRHITVDEWDLLPMEQLTWLATLFPGLLLQFPTIEPPLPLPAAEVHQKMLDAMLALFRILGREQPLCLVFDDIQYCDNATLLVLKHLIQNDFFPAHGFLLVTADEPFLSSAKYHFIGFDQITLHRQAISPITADDLNTLVTLLVGHPIVDSVLNMLVSESRGNPLAAITAILAAYDRKTDTFENLEDILVQQSASVPLWAEQKLSKLSPDTRKLLEYGAVIGSHFTFAQLSVSTGIEPDLLNRCFQELDQAGMIRSHWEMDLENGYGFTHPLLQAHILNTMTLTQKRTIAIAIIKAFQRTIQGDSDRIAAVLAYFYHEAGEPQAEWEHYIKAAKYAAAQYSPKDANEAFLQAETLMMGRLEKMSEVEIAGFYSEWVKNRLSFALFASAQQKAVTLQKIGMQFRSNYLLGTAHYLIGLSKQQLTLLPGETTPLEEFDRSLSYYETNAVTCEAIECKTEKALVLLACNRNIEALEVVEDALMDIKSIDADEKWRRHTHARAAFVYSLVLLRSADFLSAYDQLHPWTRIADSEFETARHLENVHLMAWISFHLGATADVSKNLDHVITFARKMDNNIILATALTSAGSINHAIGAIGLAWQQLTEAISLSDLHKVKTIAMRAHIAKGMLLFGFDAIELAKQEFLKAIEDAKFAANPLALDEASMCLAMAEGSLGDERAGMQMLQALIAEFTRQGEHYLRIQAQIRYYHLCVSRDPAEMISGPIEPQLRQLLHEVESRKMPIYLVYLRQILALHYHNHGSHALAINLIHQCIQLCIDLQLSTLELAASWHLLQFTGELEPAARERLRVLLEDFSASMQHPNITPIAQNYLAKFTSMIH
ncbi:MAG: AAA family ATPase [Anaerolineae bacterium]|nr:AAA family ATPase [Anaerolineae bacterium]